jgi:hypothetical protein
MNEPAYIEHDGFVRETDVAICFTIENEEVWIPLSVYERHDDTHLIIESWFAEKKGLKECY